MVRAVFGLEVRSEPQSALAVVVAFGAALRFWNIDTGMPYRIGVDEPVIAERAIHMMRTGDFNPRFYDYPGLYIYLQLIVGCVRFVSGAMSGLWRSVNEFHPEHMFLWTRMLNATIGTMTIALVYRAGMRWGHWVALTAATVFAVWPNHVRESHFALTDVPLTFLTSATLLLSLRAYESGRLLWFLAAGAGAGLAAATNTAAVRAASAVGCGMRGTSAGIGQARGDCACGRRIRVRLSHRCALHAARSAEISQRLRSAVCGLSTPALRRRREYEHRTSESRDRAGWTHCRGRGNPVGHVASLRDDDLRRWARARRRLSTRVFLHRVDKVSDLRPLSAAYRAVSLPYHGARPYRCRHMGVEAASADMGSCTHPRLRSSIGAVPGRAARGFLPDSIRPADHPGHCIRANPRADSERRPESSWSDRFSGSRTRSTGRRTCIRMTVRTPEDYVSQGITFVVASSAAFEPVLARPSEHVAEYEAYQRVFNAAGHCYPRFSPPRPSPGRRSSSAALTGRFSNPLAVSGSLSDATPGTIPSAIQNGYATSGTSNG